MQGSEAEYNPDRGCGDSAFRPEGLDLAANAASPNFATKLPHPEVRVKRKTINQFMSYSTQL